tara:strand:+ start:1463 stop:2143 length:681 start_codon:yes stop_codon:yes gene_type:complete
MIANLSVLAIIPARSGSKGIKNKNIKKFCNLPLISHTINQASNSTIIDQVVVSTDSRKIQKISIDYGAEAPFLRPKEISRDNSIIHDAVVGVLDVFKSDIIILLQPTSPLRLVSDIDNSLKHLIKKNVKSVVSGYKIKNYHASFTVTKQGFLKNFEKFKRINPNRQSHESFFTVNGAIYASYTANYLEKKTFLGASTYIYKMPQKRSVDIDDLDDWSTAEILFQAK